MYGNEQNLNKIAEAWRQYMFKVYLTDDHAILREGLKAMLNGDPELMVTNESATGKKTIRDLSKEEFNLLVLDIKLPDMDGLEVLQRVIQAQPKLRVLFLTLVADETLAIRLVRAGAAGYATKKMPPMQIVDAMRLVARGGRFLAPELAVKVVEKIFTGQEADLHEQLTNREYSIFLKLAAGMQITTIARELNLAPSTVSTHRIRILEKMNLTNNADLVRYAILRNLMN
ncbi:MAG: response regulator transcription factor [Magnetococcales bacterium]|nr:response regulator transcription factor [Magnetococcales bacterium]